MSAPAAAPAIELRSITKRFGAVVACDGVDLAVTRGEIHGVLGQNGAGKTTLMNVVAGLTPPDHGEVLVDGRAVTIADPGAAAALGIAMVHQHFSLVGPLTVWENVTLGERGRVDRSRTIDRVHETAERYGLDVDARARVDDLTTGQRQRVEIVKGLMREPSIFILDEPTSVLTVAESQELFAVLRAAVEREQLAVVLISHKLDEILRATDRVTVMRDGAVVARVTTPETTVNELAREMVGLIDVPADVSAAVGHLELGDHATRPTGATAPTANEIVLAIRAVSTAAPDGRTHLDRCTLDVRAGEILGLAGTEGNGQAGLADLLSSLLPVTSGSVEVRGAAVECGRAGAMAAAGVGVIPEDRDSASILELSVAENLAISDIEAVCTGRFVNRARLRARAQQLVAEFDITTESVDAPMRSLSGGNRQRVVLARELSRRPAVLVAAQPTRGLDVRAIEDMTTRLRAVAASGVAVVLITSELEELVSLADRIAVIHRGAIVGEMTRAELDLERLGLMMGGASAATRGAA